MIEPEIEPEWTEPVRTCGLVQAGERIIAVPVLTPEDRAQAVRRLFESAGVNG